MPKSKRKRKLARLCANYEKVVKYPPPIIQDIEPVKGVMIYDNKTAPDIQIVSASQHKIIAEDSNRTANQSVIRKKAPNAGRQRN